MSCMKLCHPHCCCSSLFPIPTAPRASPSTSLRFSHRSSTAKYSTDAHGPFSRFSSSAVFILYICMCVPRFYFFISFNRYVLVGGISVPSLMCMMVHDTWQHLHTLRALHHEAACSHRIFWRMKCTISECSIFLAVSSAIDTAHTCDMATEWIYVLCNLQLNTIAVVSGFE
jgi:hypothetical protein